MRLTPAAVAARNEGKGMWEGIGVDTLFARAVAAGGTRVALVDPPNRAALDGRPPERLDWPALQDRVVRTAAALRSMGLARDDVLAVQLPNTVDAVILFLAAARLGLIITPVVVQYREHELGHILDQTAPRAFVMVEHFAGHDHVAMASRLAASRPGLRLVPIGTLREAAAAADPADGAAEPVAGGEVLTICWTSGTEARSKGVPRDHNHWVLNARVMIEATGMRDGDVLLNPFPLVNIGSIGGLLLPWLALAGATLVLHHPFDLAVFVQQLAAERVTYTIAPPAVLTALLKAPALLADADIGALRAIGSGSAPLSPWLIEGWARTHGVEITNIFGSNEGCSLFSSPTDVPDHAERARFFPRYGAVGVDWPGLVHAVIRTRLVDPDSGVEIAEPGRPGELQLAGALTFPGYWRSPELDAAAFTDDGWFRTGDLLEIAGDGPLARFYRFVGRAKEIIVRGGVNISPAELDDLLTGMPGVREAATVGIPDPDLGERIGLAVVPGEGVPPTIADVTAWLSARDVAIFKRPERLVVLSALPRNAMNKVVRAQLRTAVLAALDGASAQG